jgi:ABC-type branched-subunit amino acid transport system permease subunit
MIGKYTEFWEIWIGGIMLAIVIFFPRGVIGTLYQWTHRKRSRERDGNATAHS